MTTTPRSILSYRITKSFKRLRDAQGAGAILAGWTGQANTSYAVGKTGPSTWTMQIFVKDTDLEGEMASAIQYLLAFGGGYGSETFTA